MAAIPAATDRAVAAMRAVGPVAEAVATGEVEMVVVATAAEIQGAEDERRRKAGAAPRQ